MVLQLTAVQFAVDDGTAVVACLCPMPPLRPREVLAHSKVKQEDGAKLTPRKRAVDEVDVEDPATTKLAVGDLVRVVGRIGEARFADSSRFLDCNSMGESALAFDVTGSRTETSVIFAEHIQDIALEVEHHLNVAQLHKEVYSKPFDLQERLQEIKRAEAEQGKDLSSSQASSSAAGSPTKRVSLRDPSSLHDC